jgi:uncharacterized membrane protein
MQSIIDHIWAIAVLIFLFLFFYELGRTKESRQKAKQRRIQMAKLPKAKRLSK